MTVPTDLTEYLIVLTIFTQISLTVTYRISLRLPPATPNFQYNFSDARLSLHRQHSAIIEMKVFPRNFYIFPKMS